MAKRVNKPRGNVEAEAAAAPGLSGVARVRTARVRQPWDSSLAMEMDRALRDLNTQRRAVGGAAAAWGEVIPGGLAERTALAGISRGVLTVRVADAATKYELDRVLRSGAERRLIVACQTPVRSVRVVIGGGASGAGTGTVRE